MNLEALASQAQAHIEAGRLDEAIQLYDTMVKERPDDAGTHHVLGLTYAARGDASRACLQIEKAIALEPEHAPYYRSLGDVLYDAGRFESCLDAYEKAISLSPADDDTRLNFGNALQRLGLWREALGNYQQILSNQPNHFKALNNIGKTYYDQGDIDKSLEFYDRSVACAPEYAEARFNRSTALLLKGDYEKGWKAYEWRFKRAESHRVYPHKLSAPRWDGGPFHGERLLVHCEQGFGDVLQFCRYLPMVKALGGQVLFECQNALIPLVSRMAHVDEVIPFDDHTPPQSPYSRYIPLLSLPGVFNTRLNTIPQQIPYLEADSNKLHQWQQQIADGRFRVGLVWAGSTVDPQRACALKDLLPLWDIPGVVFYSLQKGKAEQDLTALPPERAITALGRRLKDFDDTASVLAGLDMIISVDTAVAHLAGAMGKPVWVLLTYVPDWRWMLNRSDSPWYPTARLFRQHQKDDWTRAVHALAIALKAQTAAVDAHLHPDHTNNSKPHGVDVDIHPLFHQGAALCDAAEYKSAIPLLQQVITAAPQWAEAHFLLATAYHELGRLAQAIQAYQTAIRIDASLTAAMTNLGLAYQQNGELLKAAETYKKVIRHHRDLAVVFSNLGVVQESQHDMKAAVESYQSALQIDPGYADAHYNLGNIRLNEGDIEQAVTCYRRALETHPGHVKALGNLGFALHRMGLIEEALRCYNRAVDLNPSYAQARFNRAVSCLLVGDWENGWPDYEWRFQCADWQRTYPHKLYGERWDGSSFKEKTVLVHSEQGIGDALMFCRYLPLVKERGGRVIFEVRRSLFRLFHCLEGVDELLALSEDKPPSRHYDAYVPLCSLPLLFNSLPGDVPDKVPYLKADPQKIVRYKQRLPSQGLNVGLVWGGNDTYKERSLALETLSPLAFVKGINWIGLQKGPASVQAAASRVPRFFNIVNWGGSFEDFSDTAAAVDCLDLVISIDTSVAHLAGAMGKPVWVLLPLVPDWRWMLERTHSPWYPTMRLFRQSKSEGWQYVITRVSMALEQWRNKQARQATADQLQN